MNLNLGWGGVREFLSRVLPTSPFTEVIATIQGLPFLGQLNWFIPVGTCLHIFSLWLTAYSLYLLYIIVLRWAKVAGG